MFVVLTRGLDLEKEIVTKKISESEKEDAACLRSLCWVGMGEVKRDEQTTITDTWSERSVHSRCPFLVRTVVAY